MIRVNLMDASVLSGLRQRRYRERYRRIHGRNHRGSYSDPKYSQHYFEENPARSMLQQTKSRAKKRGFEFSITEKDILPLPKVCPVLGIPLNWKYGGKGGRPNDDSPSLDRIDSTRGYVPGNVKIISVRANRIKSDATAEELGKVLRYVEEFS